jgi:hypothetical protein
MVPSFRVNASSLIFFVVLFVLAYLLGPVALIWGWLRWANRPKRWTPTAILSFLGFALATASALLAVVTAAYVQVHYFAFYDPLLMRIFRWGALLSAAGLLFGVGGAWRENSLRWFAIAGAVGTFAFWLCAAEGE